MRTVFVISLMFLAVTTTGQTFEEWTSQKKTQIKYLLAQIAANKAYIEYVQRGYGIARKGLNTIQNIKRGDFNLHLGFINSLGTVNPKVKSYARVADIIAYQLRIVKNINTTIRNLKESNKFANVELDYCKTVFERLLEESLKDIDELFLIITSDELQMKDDERIKRIDQLYLEMQDKYGFCQSFSDECSVLAMRRLNEQAEIQTSKKLNGIE